MRLLLKSDNCWAWKWFYLNRLCRDYMVSDDKMEKSTQARAFTTKVDGGRRR